MYGHLRKGSIRVKQGETIATRAQLGTVGNSGNSTMPHLHFQLMDGPDPLTARGLPCAFRGYERFVNGAWEPVERGVPDAMERVRCSLPA
jgi:murein DD-endopeptidase MepM/ murein hydrolase activator NlpD